MNIVIFNWRDVRHPLSGGAEISLFEHAKYWKKMKNNVIWFSSGFKGAKKQEIIDGIQFVRRGSHYTSHFWGFLYYIFGRFGSVDIVIDNFHFIPFFTPLYISPNKIVGLIHEVAGKLWFENIPYVFAYIGCKLESLSFFLYRKVQFITVSSSTKHELIKNGIESGHITVIHNGIHTYNINRQIKKERTPTLLFLGRISKDKGIKDAFEVFIHVKRKIVDCKLWIVGREEKRGFIKTFLKDPQSNKIKSDIKYFGYVQENKKFELLKKAWILIHPSKKEGWGLTIIEAASQGTPTVGYNVAGLRDSVLNKKTGILTIDNSDALTKSVLILINNKALYNKMSKQATIWSQKFEWEDSTQKSYKLLLNVISKSNNNFSINNEKNKI